MRDDDLAQHRRLLWLLVLVSLSVLCLGSFTPFNFTRIDSEALFAGLQKMQSAGVDRRSRIDFGVNLTVMIPLAFAINGILTLGGLRARLPAIIATLVLCLLASSLVELTQIFLPGRIPSLGDVTAQLLGALLGVLAWDRFGTRLLGFIRPLDEVMAAPPLVRAASLWIAGLVAYSMLPFDLTVHPVDIYQKWKAGSINLLPFAVSHRSPVEALFAYATDIAVWLPMGVVAGHRCGGRLRCALLQCVGAVVGVELLQLMVQSRFTDVTDILLGSIGGFAGSLLVARAGSSTPALPTGSPAASHSLVGIWLLAFYSLVLLLGFTAPWQFDADLAEAMQRAQHYRFSLFRSQQGGNVLVGLFDVVRTTLLFSGIGVLLAWLLCRSAARTQGVAGALLAALWSLGVAGLIQGLRLFQTQKILDFTDVVIAVLGAVAGFWMARQFLGGGVDAMPAVAGESRSAPLVDHDRAERPAAVTAPSASRGSGGAFGLRFTFALLLVGGMIWVLQTSPATPYNVRELFGRLPPMLAIPLFSPASVLAMMVPILLLRVTIHRYGCAPGPLLLALFVLLLAGWLMVYAVVPNESIYDVVGSPVWHAMPRGIELGYRFVFFALPVAGAGVLAATFCLPTREAGRPLVRLRRQLLAVHLLAFVPLSFLVVVVQAGTDNITELLPDDGYSWRVILLMLYPLLLSVNAAALARIDPRSVGIVPGLAVTVALAYGAYEWVSLGFADIVVKYGRAFTPLQFLLSPSREQLLAGASLRTTFLLVHLAVVLAWASAMAAARAAPLSRAQRSAYLSSSE